MGADQESSGQAKPTLKMYFAVQCGLATSAETRLVEAALRDPHSELWDLLEGMQCWAEGALKRYGSASSQSEEILHEAEFKSHRKDVMDFARRLRAGGQITEAELSKVLEAGTVVEDPSRVTSSNTYRRAVASMFTALLERHPELERDIRELQNRGEMGPDHSRG